MQPTLVELCDFCASVPFEEVGLLIEASDDDNQDRRTSTSPIDLDSMGWFFSTTRSGEDLLKCSPRCRLCEHILSRSLCYLDRQKGTSTIDINHVEYFYTKSTLYSVELDQRGRHKASLTQIHVSLKERVSNLISRQLRTFRFQSCSATQLQVSHQCDAKLLFTPSNKEQLPYGGRIRPQYADSRLLQMWKEHCLNTHGTLCSTAQTETISINLRLIDVEDRCIVEIQRCERWVALSYVWGNANKLVLTSETLDQYQEHGSIKPGVTSATIEDAITVTGILGERYLWVDSLCILQDSEADKELYIPLMGFIYGKALLTIICASGSSAEAGLPGIQVSSRKMQPLVFKTGTSTFMTTLDPEDTEGWSYTTSSAWCTRAWTLQERLFSKRALIFTPELIYWECQKATWREDSFWEVSSSPNFYQACWGDKSFWNHDRLATLWRSDEFNFVDLYRQLVSHYTQLHLSFNEDGLNAITGIVNDLKRRSGYNFIWALPTPFLSAFLAWEDYSTYEDVIPGRHYRRTAQCNFPSETGISRRCHFPSWSWVGWTGKTWYPISESDSFQQSDIVFYIIDNGNFSRIATALSSSNTTSSWRRIPSWNANGETILTQDHIPTSILFNSLTTTILGFWTSVAFVNISWRNVDLIWLSYSNTSRVEAGIHQGKIDICSTWNQVPSTAKSQSEEPGCLCIIGTKPEEEAPIRIVPSELYINALLVSWKDGIAYRQGLAQIKESDWLRLEERVWKPIFLG